MKNTSFTKKTNLLLATTLLVLGCTEKREFDTVDEDKSSIKVNIPKSMLALSNHDTKGEYLYLASDINSSLHTDATFPMYMGDPKLVKLELTEGALNVLEVEQDERFGGNVVNAKPVISLPIEHLDFKCKEDADGKCSNVQEVDIAKPWAQRQFIKVLADKVTSQSVEAKPLEITSLFYNCYKEVGSALTELKVTEDAINISVDKAYVADLACAPDTLESLSDLTFRVVNHYSLVKINKLASPDYRPLSYKRAEETTFGFFDTRTLKLDRDNNSTVNSEKVFVNRWNPDKSKVVYHLTENFNKPENAKIKAATISAVENINSSLKKAGAVMQIELRDAFPGMNPGDLRVNSIALVEDPVNFGILGYGPTAANPLTGEILHGRAAMYLGVMKTGIQRAYEEVRLEMLSEQAKAKAETKSETSSDGSGDIVVVNGKSGPMSLAPELQKYQGQKPSIDASTYAAIRRAIKKSETMKPQNQSAKHSHKLASATDGGKDIISKPISKKALEKRALKLNERRLTLKDVALLKDDESIREQFMSTHCFFGLDDLNIHDSIEDEIKKVIEEVGAKPWLALSTEEKDKVIDALMPFVWVPTLIHEIGHTLGLRHNFAGSEDKANFYTEEERKELGVKREFAYSSVMDYGYRSTNELQVMGKYDIAALRFAYAEKIELNNGDLISLEDFRNRGPVSDPKLEAKEFKFCTDEHVAVNPNCNRFDEGTSLVEIAQHFARMHEENYYRRNFRNGLRSFSLYDDATQIRRSGLIMSSLRTMFERYEDIKKTFNLTDNDPVWEEYDFLKDLKLATRIAGGFLVQLIQTPDTLCAVSQVSAPNQIIGVLPLRAFSPYAISCFDQANVQINPAYMIVGEGGKSFQSRKDPNSGNPYIDQIDVRGLWIDKLLAVNALLGRTTGIESFDEHTGNFLDLTDIREYLQGAMGALLLDEVVTQVPIFTVTGQVLVAELPVKLFDKSESQNGHKISKPLHPGVQRYFRLPNEGVDFQVHLINVLKSSLPSQEQESDETSLLNSIAVNSGLPIGSAPEEFLTADIGIQRYYVNLKSQIAGMHVVSRDINGLFGALGEEKLTQILADIEAGKSPAENAPEAEKIAHALGAEIITKYLLGGFQDNSFYERMIRAMAN